MTSETLRSILKSYWPSVSDYAGTDRVDAFATRISSINVDESDVRRVCDELSVLEAMFPSDIIPAVWGELKSLHNSRAQEIREQLPADPEPGPEDGRTIAEHIRDVVNGKAEGKRGWTRSEYQGAVRLADKYEREPRLGDLLFIRHSNNKRAEELAREQRIANRRKEVDRLKKLLAGAKP